MDARIWSINKHDVTTFFTKILDNHKSETHVTGVYNPICAHTLWFHMLQLNLIHSFDLEN